jgi:two-component system, NarL family, invasion response regulator UvrY
MIHILLVDDHTLFREGLKQILGKYPDLQVMDETATGHEALEKIASQNYTVIILDISMPGLSGWDILKEIKRIKPDIAVLILSMHPEDQYAVRMLKAGAAGYVCKESAAEELVTAIRKVASGGKYVSAAVAEQLAFAVDRGTDKPPHELLSNREFQVMCMLASGRALKEIAEELCLSEKTVTTYRARILEKLQLRNNVELAYYVLQNRLLEK